MQTGNLNLSEISSRPTVMEVDLKTICNNYRVLKSIAAPARCMAVLKANAYGHGLIQTAQALERSGVDYIGVALVEEGLELRKAGIKAPIHVFGGILSEQIDAYIMNELEVTASSIDKLIALSEAAKKLKKQTRVHLKIDTGMGRIGVHYKNASKLFEAVQKAPCCEIVGVFSHLAAAEENDPSFTLEQILRFKGCKDVFQGANNAATPIFHLANSAGAIRFPDARFDMVRTGLALYGVNPVPAISAPLNGAITLKSKIVYFKVVQKGTPISYGGTWRAPKMTRIVTVPIGYGDGFFRRLSNAGSALIRGKRYPIVGKVCMDQIMIDIGWDEAFNGDEVVLIGKQGSEEITVSEIARLADTVEHEVLTSTNARVPRKFL